MDPSREPCLFERSMANARAPGQVNQPRTRGQYALALAIVLPVLMFTNLQLRWIVTADVDEQRRFGDYLSFRLFSTLLALVVIFASALFAGYRGQLRLVIVLVGFAQAIEAISDVYYARLQLGDRMDRIAKSVMARTCYRRSDWGSRSTSPEHLCGESWLSCSRA